MEFISGLSSDLEVLSSPLVTIAKFLEPFGAVASAISKLIGLLP